MKKFIFPSCLFFFIILTSQNCKKHNEPILYNTEFPNNIGTFWKYKVYDSISTINDTLTITIVGTTNLNDGKVVTIWQNKYQTRIPNTDTSYIYSGSEGIYFYFNKTIQSLYKIYKFPLTIGNYWLGNYVKDTIKVTSKSSINTLAGSFSETYTLTRTARFFPNGSLFEQELFKPNIGLLTSLQINNSGSYSNENWELFSYLIK